MRAQALGALWLTLGLSAVACGQTKLVASAPRIVVTPSVLDFGQTPIFFPVHKTLLVTDAGSLPLHLSGVTLTGDGKDAFTLITLPSLVAPGQGTLLEVACSPKAQGVVGAQLVISSDDPDEPETTIGLTGEGTTAASISVSPASLDFGRVGEGQSATREFQVHSNGPADLFFSAFGFSNQNGFGLVGSLAPGSVLPAGQAATLAVHFSPTPDTATGESALVISSSDPQHSQTAIALHATINRAPVARARAYLTGDPPQDLALTTAVGALVHLDGSTSSDPDGDTPLTYKWTLALRPGTSNATIDSDTSVSTAVLLDQPGLYSAQLVATDATGLASFLPGRIDLRAVPPLELVVELVWDAQRPDLDLHLREDGTSLDSSSDCSWLVPDPQWFPGGADKNPHHQGDQLVGYGPELIEWKTPTSGTYRIAAVLKNLNGATVGTTARVRVHAFGVLVAELSKLMSAPGEVWEAGAIDWPTGRVSASAAPGQTSEVREVSFVRGALETSAWRTE
ncbi:MAG: choice-of-anchor D domain-containing protein [Deltaproteobacteria bacterium]|nr:choice-of-anchor D domain-containing protein [Deltaproteobacteria bacterium]